uniref:Uncharacterized protein n=1 Tax=Panagrolaimus sp. PS1159 TaxID=55785 RepID=A0AC35FPN5_9BILA
MVNHVGIDPHTGKISAYNTLDKVVSEYAISEVRSIDDIEKIDVMFNEIRSTIDGEFGCACIYLRPDYLQKFRKQFIASCISHGFAKVQIIYWETVKFYTVVPQTNYEPNDSDIILICSYSTAYVWKYQYGIFKLHDSFDLVASDNIYPNVVFYDQITDFSSIEKFFPDANFIIHEFRNYNHGALYKARMMGNDPDITNFNLENPVNRQNGIATVALDNNGERLLPSYVAYDEKNVKCGQIVFNRLRNYSKSSVFDSKRLIGKMFFEIKVDHSWPFEIIPIKLVELTSDNEIEEESDEFYFNIKVQTSTGDVNKNPEEVSADLLKDIKLKAEVFQGKKIDKAVITVPAAFNNNQRQATYNAAMLAGFHKVDFLPEPVAAAFAYFIDRPIPNSSTLLLFDLGGGTLDVCIFKIENNKLEIISQNGDTTIGGRDFDNLLIRHFEQQLTEEYQITITESRKYKLMLKCQEIKENLSTLITDKLDVEDIHPSVEANLPISRHEFEIMSMEMLNEIRQNVRAALTKINYEPSQINKVLQVGGGCRMPMIKDMLQQLFPNSEQCCEEHPEEVVAVGATYYSYYLNLPQNSPFFVMRTD